MNVYVCTLYEKRKSFPLAEHPCNVGAHDAITTEYYISEFYAVVSFGATRTKQKKLKTNDN